MASVIPLNDIDEQFLQCGICMEKLKEPKFLPCIHRFCQECLKGFTEEGEKKIQCVTCKKEHILPENGIDGLKNDFNTKNIIEFIQLQDAVIVDPLRTCTHCKKKLKASAFCFRCDDFLCVMCHDFHATSGIVKDHYPHIFSLSGAEAANLTIEKLSSMKEAPKCQAHPGKLSELCCTTCDNLPICMLCTYGKHRGHDLTEITSLAEIQREMLRDKVAYLMQYKEDAYQMHDKVRETKEDLERNVNWEEQRFQKALDSEEERIEKEIRNTEEELKRKHAKLEEEMETKEECEQVCEEGKGEVDASLKKLREESKKETERLQEELRGVKDRISKQLASLKTRKDKQAKKIDGTSDYVDRIVNRFETVTTTSDCIRAAQNDWADVQCIPDVCRAIDLLSKDVKAGSEGLDYLLFEYSTV